MLSRLAATLLGRARPLNPASLPPARHRESVPASDEAPLAATALGGQMGGLIAEISYTDTVGAHSRRRISIERVGRTADGMLLLQAFCHVRQARRSFRVDRIDELIDLETGEIVADIPRWLAEAGGAPAPRTANPTPAAPPAPPLTGWPRIQAELGAELAILLFLARADGRMVAAERSAIADWLDAMIPDHGMARAELDGWIARSYPHPDLYRESVTILADKPKAHIAKLVRGIVMVIKADGRIDPAERRFADELRAALSG